MEFVIVSEEHTLDFRLLEVGIQLTTLKEHHDLIQDHIAQAEKAAEAKLKAGLQNLSLNDVDDGEADILQYEYDYHVEVVLPRIHRDPLVVVLYSVYESGVREVARHISGTLGVVTGIGSNPDFLTCAKSFFDHYLGLKLSENSSRWERLHSLRQIRNLIVHGNGRLDLASPIQKKIVQDERIKEFLGFILIDEKYLEDLFRVVTSELEDLVERYKQWDTVKRGAL